MGAAVPLIEAFRRNVLKDADYVRAIDAAAELRDSFGMPNLAFVMRQGAFPSRSSQWPAVLDPAQLLHAWFEPMQWPMPIDGQAEPLLVQREVDDATLDCGWPFAIKVFEVFRRFLEPLRSGMAQATGETRDCKREPISRATWQRPATLIDFQQGEISRFNPDDDGDIVEREWTAIEITYEKDSEIFNSISIGKERYSWDIAFNSVFMWMLSYEIPKTGAELCLLFENALETINGDSPGIDYIEKVIRKKSPDFWRFVTRKTKPAFSTVPVVLKPPKRKTRKQPPARPPTRKSKP